MNFTDFIQNTYRGTDYTSAAGAGSLGLQKIQRIREKIAKEQGEDVAKQFERDAKVAVGIGGALPLILGAHMYTFGPMAAGAVTAEAAATQGGVAGSLILGDLSGAAAGLSTLANSLKSNKRYDYNQYKTKK